MRPVNGEICVVEDAMKTETTKPKPGTAEPLPRRGTVAAWTAAGVLLAALAVLASAVALPGGAEALAAL